MARCPICGRTKPHKQDIIDHVESVHKQDIPEGISTAQYIYSLVHGRMNGLCRECGRETKWNEKTGKPYQICERRECREKRNLAAKANMMKVYGKPNLLNDIEQQEKMLANRRISGTYTWSDHKHKFIYTGTYEKFAIEWLDKVMDLDPDTIQMPGPIIEYELNGEKKLWITDMYLTEFNLVIEIKDGGLNKNTHPGFAPNREREKAKDAAMMKQNKYNYIKITGKNMMSLVKILSEIRLNNILGNEKQAVDKPFITINEAVDSIVDTNTFISNSRINELCESIVESYKLSNQEAVSVASLSPIMGGAAFVDNENNNIFSDRHTKDYKNPFDPSDNFQTTDEEVIADIELDPGVSGTFNAPAEISKSTYSSALTLNENKENK